MGRLTTACMVDGVRYGSITEAAQAVGVNPSSLWNAVSGYRRSFKGHTVRNLGPGDYSNNGRKIRCVETGEVFPSVSEACRHCYITTGCIYPALQNAGRTAAGYHWEYVV